MSAFTRPFLLSADGQSKALERLPFAADQQNGFTEEWLQRALFEYPDSLPVKEIDPHIGELIPVCMEIETGAGPADLLYVTPSGQVVLVETKLWRNPEARREVVGQILDYAKQLTTWTFDMLDQRAALAAKSEGGHLLRCLLKRQPQADQAAFVDGIGRSLATGDFLLLVVGDGIRYGAEALVNFLERYGHLKFGIGLIEVATYALPDGGRLLQPRVLAKTEILQRTILMGPTGAISLQQAAAAEDSTESNMGQREWYQNFWRDVLARLKVDALSSGPSEPARSTNQFFAVPPGMASAWISAYVAQYSKKGGVYLTFAKSYDRGPDIYERLLAEREAIEREMGVAMNWERTGGKVYISVPTVNLGDLDSAPERQRVTAYLADMTERMLRVFTPRLAAEARAVA